MSRHLNIIPECHADTLPVEIAGYKNPNHQANNSEVIRVMETSFKNRKAIGLIDNDKVKARNFDHFAITEKENDLTLLAHPNAYHFLIMVTPAFERWVFNAAQKTGIDPNKYGFKTMKYFKAKSKNINVASDQQFKQFLNAIKQKKNSPFLTLNRWIDKTLNL